MGGLWGESRRLIPPGDRVRNTVPARVSRAAKRRLGLNETPTTRFLPEVSHANPGTCESSRGRQRVPQGFIDNHMAVSPWFSPQDPMTHPGANGDRFTQRKICFKFVRGRLQKPDIFVGMVTTVHPGVPFPKNVKGREGYGHVRNSQLAEFFGHACDFTRKCSRTCSDDNVADPALTSAEIWSSRAIRSRVNKWSRRGVPLLPSLARRSTT